MTDRTDTRDLPVSTPFDPDRPAAAKPIATEDLLRQTLYAVQALADTLTPGVPGVEGAQDPPEAEPAQLTVKAGVVTPVPGHIRYKSRTFCPVTPGATLYLVKKHDIALGDGVTKGLPILELEKFTTENRGTVYLAADIDCDVRLWIEAS